MQPPSPFLESEGGPSGPLHPGESTASRPGAPRRSAVAGWASSVIRSISASLRLGRNEPAAARVVPEPPPPVEAEGAPPDTRAPLASASDMLPYLVPMCAYVGLGAVEGILPQVDGRPAPLWYLAAYAGRLSTVASLAWWYRSTWKDLRPFPTARNSALSVLIGLVVWGLWIGLDGLYPAMPFLGSRAGFDPAALGVVPRSIFIAVRFLGLVVLVPLIEELFWRSFLIRWLLDPDFQNVPIGRVTVMSAAVTSVFFALVHPEWLPALLTGFLWAWLLRQTKSVFACLISHATANLALGVYIIEAGAWQYW
jgi:CAAX protease family protein